MRTIVINRNVVPVAKRELDVKEVYGTKSGEVLTFAFITATPHHLQEGGKVNISKISDIRPVEKSYPVEVINDTTFRIKLSEYAPVVMENVAMDGEKPLLIPVNDNIRNYTDTLNKVSMRYGSVEFSGHVTVSYDKDGNPTNEEDVASMSIACDTYVEGLVGRCYVEVVENWLYRVDGIGDIAINLDELTMTEDSYSLDVSLPLGNELSYRLNDEQGSLNSYFEGVKNSIIPDIVDNEKEQFAPIVQYQIHSKSPKRNAFATEIEFNLHFRSRYDEKGNIREDWSTTDNQLWNNMELKQGQGTDAESDDVLKYKVVGFDDTYADELNQLGFTEDDIRFSKTKVGKSFLRLLFYSSKDMLSKELLHYSTIFMDTGELGRIYNNIKTRGLEVFDSGRTDDSLRLSARFTVKNKYLSDKSSEGFYLYLFPSEVSGETTSRTIYMKVEFNHAGYGKTVPMMLPRSGGAIQSTTLAFPLHFCPMVYDDEQNVSLMDFDYEAYQDAVMIPLEISYDSTLKSYVYRFSFAENDNGKIVLNLFEPRVKGYQ